MSDKLLIVQGAICKCQYGSAMDKLKIITHSKEYANDNAGNRKLIASTKDTGGATFEANTFGSCAKKNNTACKIVVQEWKDYYDKITLNHKGKVLTESSKAICPVGGNPCIEIIWHGQTASVSNNSAQKADQRTQAQLNPLADTGEIQQELEGNYYYQ